MTSVGLVGGLGPESTVDYYMRILRGWEAEAPDSAPSIVIDFRTSAWLTEVATRSARRPVLAMRAGLRRTVLLCPRSPTSCTNVRRHI